MIFFEELNNKLYIFSWDKIVLLEYSFTLVSTKVPIWVKVVKHLTLKTRFEIQGLEKAPKPALLLHEPAGRGHLVLHAGCLLTGLPDHLGGSPVLPLRVASPTRLRRPGPRPRARRVPPRTRLPARARPRPPRSPRARSPAHA